jgi:hypothetical protein
MQIIYKDPDILMMIFAYLTILIISALIIIPVKIKLYKINKIK